MNSKFILCGAVLVLAAWGCGKEAKRAAPPPPPPSTPPPAAPAPMPFGPAARPKASPAEVSEAVRGNNAFACALYAKLAAGRKDSNLFFSPFSVSTALGMTYAGARGSTAAEMRKALCLTLPDAKLHPAMGALLYDLNAVGKDGQVQLSVANALWGQQGHKFLPAFLVLNKADYGAGLETVDFGGNTEGARQTINGWAEKQTRGKIQDLVAPGVLDKLTRLVLTDAIYFKGGWSREFDARDTKDEPFKLGGGRKVTTPMMGQRSYFDYAEGRGFKALELPYRGSGLSMLVLLPDKDDGLAALEKSLAPEIISKLKLSEADVTLELPKFKMSSEFSLAGTLQSLGMKAAFAEGAADLSGMDGVRNIEQRLYLRAVIHKAFVEVSEKGTEAAAATAVEAPKCEPGIPEPPKRKVVRFIADHPFVFAIRDRQSGSILFLGRVVNPKG